MKAKLHLTHDICHFVQQKYLSPTNARLNKNKHYAGHWFRYRRAAVAAVCNLANFEGGLRFVLLSFLDDAIWSPPPG